MNSNFILTAYYIYLPVAVALTIYVSRNLFRNGKIFMLDIFNGRENIAQATNKLFEVGFYLMNIGFALIILKIDHMVPDKQVMVEMLSRKIGGFSIYLGVMLFLNMYLFFRGKRKSAEQRNRQNAVLNNAEVK